MFFTPFFQLQEDRNDAPGFFCQLILHADRHLIILFADDETVFLHFLYAGFHAGNAGITSAGAFALGFVLMMILDVALG